ncbi:hypothetical protein ACHAXT_003523 [Thalassiosira profunda]
MAQRNGGATMGHSITAAAARWPATTAMPPTDEQPPRASRRRPHHSSDRAAAAAAAATSSGHCSGPPTTTTAAMTRTGGRAARRASALALGLLAAASCGAAVPALELPSRARDVHQVDSHPNDLRPHQQTRHQQLRQPQLRQTGPRRHGSRRLKKDGEAAPFDPSDGVRRPTLLQNEYNPGDNVVHAPKSDKGRGEHGSGGHGYGYGPGNGSGYGHGGSKSSKGGKSGKSAKSSKGGKSSKRGKSGKAGGHGGPYGEGYSGGGYPGGGGAMEGDVWLDGPEDSFLVVDEAGEGVANSAGDEGGDGAAGEDGVGDDVDGTGQNLEFLLDEGSAGGSLPATEDGSDGGSDNGSGTDGTGVDPGGWSNDATLDALLDAASDVTAGLDALLDAAAGAEGPAALAPAAREEAIVAKCGRSSVDRSWSLIRLLGDFAPDEGGEPTASLVAQEGPWYDAYVWLAHLDGAIVCPPEDILDGASEDGGAALLEREAAVGRIRQRYALATLYFATGGDDWNECAAGRRWFDEGAGAGAGGCPDGEGRWLDASHECTWYNVTCEEGTVTKIDLTGNGLEGEVPFGALALLEEGGLVSYLRVSKMPTSPPAP